MGDKAVAYLRKARKAHEIAYLNALLRNGAGVEEIRALEEKLMAVEWLLQELGEPLNSERRENG